MQRRTLLRGSAALAAAASWPTAWGQAAFPQRPLTIVVPFPPGGAMDLTARTVGERLGAELRQPVIIDNRAGAGGAIAAQFVARAPADGYTLMISNQGPNVIREILYPATAYRTERDFAMVSTLTTSPLVLVVPAESPFKTVKQLVDVGPDKSRTMNFASAGVGSQSQIAGEGLNVATGNAFLHVAYAGAAKQLMALLSREVHFSYVAAADALPRVADGTLRALAVASARRFPLLPQVPTLAEAGVRNQEFDVWYGLMVPAGTPGANVAALREAVVKVMQQDDIQAKFRQMGVAVQTSTGEEMAARFARDRTLYADVIRKANIKPE